MKKTKIDILLEENGGEEGLIKKINKELNENSLTKIAQNWGIGKSTLSGALTSMGYKYYKDSNLYQKVENNKIELDMEDYKMLATGKFTKNVSFRGEEEIVKNFETLARDKFPNIPLAKIYSLALRDFTEKYK